MQSIIAGDYPLTQHFRLHQFWCPCCHSAELSNLRRLCMRLEAVRADYGAMAIVSGYRCFLRNLEMDGQDDSRHLEGKAADIRVWTDEDRFRLVWALLANGFKRIGIGRTIIHADIDESGPPVLWTYRQGAGT